MGTPATLTDIDGIGPATAKKLEAAGIASIADLAAADAAKLEELDGMPPGAKFADWIAAAKTLQGEVEDQSEIHEASGADAETEGAAASKEDAEAKVSDAKGADAADPAGTAGASAAQADESREQAPNASADRKDAGGEEKQPGETAQPPVADIEAGPAIVVTGPKAGFRRAGFRFDRQPRTIPLREFGEGIDALRRVLAILAEPRLTVVCPDKNGVGYTPDQKTVEELIALTAPGGDREIDPENLHELVHRMFGAV